MKTHSLFVRVLHMALATLLATFAIAGAVAAADYFKTAGNFAVYLGVVPAEMVLGHSPEHPKGKMHGGVPFSGRQHHVVIAIFDTKDGTRIDNAEVTARVGAIGLGATEKKLERMIIANTVSFGNYFDMSGTGPYRIEIEIRRPGSSGVVQTSFDYSPPRR